MLPLSKESQLALDALLTMQASALGLAKLNGHIMSVWRDSPHVVGMTISRCFTCGRSVFVNPSTIGSKSFFGDALSGGHCPLDKPVRDDHPIGGMGLQEEQEEAMDARVVPDGLIICFRIGGRKSEVQYVTRSAEGDDKLSWGRKRKRAQVFLGPADALEALCRAESMNAVKSAWMELS